MGEVAPCATGAAGADRAKDAVGDELGRTVPLADALDEGTGVGDTDVDTALEAAGDAVVAALRVEDADATLLVDAVPAGEPLCVVVAVRDGVGEAVPCADDVAVSGGERLVVGVRDEDPVPVLVFELDEVAVTDTGVPVDDAVGTFVPVPDGVPHTVFAVEVHAVMTAPLHNWHAPHCVGEERMPNGYSLYDPARQAGPTKPPAQKSPDGHSTQDVEVGDTA